LSTLASWSSRHVQIIGQLGCLTAGQSHHALVQESERAILQDRNATAASVLTRQHDSQARSPFRGFKAKHKLQSDRLLLLVTLHEHLEQHGIAVVLIGLGG
jgi:hypothetical protein